MAGETTELAKPVIGTSVPAPAKRTRELYRFSPVVSAAAYYVMMDISEFGYDSDLKFCEDLTRLVGVGAVPGSSFFREPVNHLIRFHFAKKDETLLNALNRLESLRAKLPSRKRN